MEPIEGVSPAQIIDEFLAQYAGLKGAREARDALAALTSPPDLKADNAALREVLRLFEGAAYPVATEINPRGYNWCEAYLDQALKALQATEPRP